VIYFVSNTEAATEMNESMSTASNIWLHVRSKMLRIQKKRVTHTSYLHYQKVLKSPRI